MKISLAFEQTEPGGLMIYLFEMMTPRTSPLAESSTTKIKTGFSSAPPHHFFKTYKFFFALSKFFFTFKNGLDTIWTEQKYAFH